MTGALFVAHHAKGRVHVRSASPQEFPKPLTDQFVQVADAVVTMGCGDVCPIYPGKRYEDWELGTRPVEVVRRIRDDIVTRVQQLLAELVQAGA